LPVIRMEHFTVLTDDIDGTRDFYARVLGLAVGFRPPLEFTGYWMYLDGVPCLHIVGWQSYLEHSRKTGIPVSLPAPTTGAFDHIAFTGTDHEGFARHLHAQGVPAHVNVAAGAGLWQFFFVDPNGVKIEVNIPARQAAGAPGGG
jgi:catechol 2,3-dioxygenase-like lactoylglutathione lyase family enzyme